MSPYIQYVFYRWVGDTMRVLLTCTDDSCIFTVGTEMHSKTTMGTLSEAGFTATAVHFIIPYWTTSSSISIKCSHSSAIAQLTTDYWGILQAPAIIAHSTPGPIMVDLHTPLMWTRPSHQAHISFTWAGGRSSTDFQSLPYIHIQQRVITNIGTKVVFHCDDCLTMPMPIAWQQQWSSSPSPSHHNQYHVGTALSDQMLKWIRI